MRRGFTLVEVVVSLLIVSGLMVAALNTVGAVGRTRRVAMDQARAALLADALMQEILSQPYLEPGTTGGPFSPGSGSDRSSFDDVDDYVGWKASPPQAKDGSALNGFDGWTRSVTVQWLDPAELAKGSRAAATGETGVKLVSVRVGRGDAVLVRRVAVRSAAMDGLSVDKLEKGEADGMHVWSW